MAKPSKGALTAIAEVDRLLSKYPNPRDVRRAPTLERTGSPLREASPELYGFLGGAMGTAPDEFEGSVLDPLYARVKAGANYGYPLGLAAEALPGAALLAKFGAKAAPVAMRNAMVPAQLGKQAGVIKAPGGNWLSGSVEDALKGLKQRIETPADATPRLPWTEQDELENVPRHALNSFIDKQLTRYVKNDMATERDPIRALAERGVLHVDPETLPAYNATKTGVARSPLAEGWEGASDYIVKQKQADHYWGEPGVDPSAMLKDDPWIAKVPPKTPIYEANQNISVRLGFNHLMDELRNATNPNSGLPQHLLLDPKSLDRVSVPQAVERVAAINEWRAAQKAEADAARANNAATVLHKEYPDKGFKWVELKVGDDAKLPGGFSLEPEKFARSGELAGYRVIGPDKKSVAFGKTEAEAIREANIPALKDALKYEGDTMGHCVGGYCDDVASGATRIYSLRDAKGQPHVTVEVQPTKVLSDIGVDALPDKDYDRVVSLADRLAEERLPGGVTTAHDIEAAYAQLFPQPSPRIVQIKGKGNKKPNDEYLPFVQDFVKGGRWSEVGDLQNTGLRRSRDVWNDAEQAKIRAAQKEFGEYVMPEDIEQINRAVWPDDSAYQIKIPPTQGYAAGGTVTAAPTWTDLYSEYTNQDWFKKQQSDYGGQIDRPWNSDDGTRQAKQTIDDNYLKRLAEYNKANGTELAPDAKMLGADAQPNDWNRKQNESGGFFGHALGAIGDTLKDPAKGLTNLSHDIAKNPIANVALTAAGAYFGLPPSLTAALLGANRTGVDGDIAAGLKTGIASYGAGKLLPDLGWGQAAQSAAGNTFSGLLGGNNIGDSLKNAGIGYIGGQAGSEVAGLTDSDFAGKAANSLTQTALKGKDIGSTLDQLATQYASGQLTDLSGMDPKMAAIVVNLARNKKGAAANIAAGALTQAAQRAVGSAKLSDLAVGS